MAIRCSLGLVASLNRPGGNVTGATQLNVEVGHLQRLELAHELIPAARVIALLVNPTNPLTEPILNGSASRRTHSRTPAGGAPCQQ